MTRVLRLDIWDLIWTAWKGNTKSTRSISISHIVQSRIFKALSTSIIKAIYTKKYIYLQKHTTCHFSMILCALHVETLQFTNSFHFTTLWRRAFSAITYSNRLSVMRIRFIGHLGSARALLLQHGTHCSEQRATTKRLMVAQDGHAVRINRR